MARAVTSMEQSVVDAIAQWGGWIATIAVGIFALWGNKRKADVDESGHVLASWRQLLETHQTDMSAMRKEFADYKAASAAEFAAYKAEATAEITALRERVRVLEEDNRTKAKYIDGLERQIAQNSKSTAYQIQRATAKIDEADKGSCGK